MFHEWLASNNREYQQKVENYIGTEKYSVKKFNKKFPELKIPFTADKISQEKYQSSLLRCLNESRFKTMFASSKSVSYKDFVRRILNATIPKSLFVAFVNNSDDIDDSIKAEMKDILEYVFGEEMEIILTEKCKSIMEYQSEKRQNKLHIHSYKYQFEDQMCCSMMIQYEIFNKIASVDKQLMQNFLNSEKCLDYFKNHLKDEPNAKQNEKLLFNSGNFIEKVVGRKCGNCGKRENRCDDIEKFYKCSSCKHVFYCTRSCQK
eukprot:361554_1